jgi:hypothetical protein
VSSKAAIPLSANLRLNAQHERMTALWQRIEGSTADFGRNQTSMPAQKWAFLRGTAVQKF